jgi:hypothetical protein
MHALPIFVVQLNRAPGLPLGVEASFSIDDDVIWLACHKSRLRVVAGNQRAIHAVACVIELGVELQIVDSEAE